MGNSPSITNRNSANLRDHDDPAPIVNDTQLITKKLSDVSMNNGNFAVSDDNDHGLFDNDRKEGDYETYPYEYHERNGKNTQERTLSIASQESAGAFIQITAITLNLQRMQSLKVCHQI